MVEKSNQRSRKLNIYEPNEIISLLKGSIFFFRIKSLHLKNEWNMDSWNAFYCEREKVVYINEKFIYFRFL